MKFLYFKGITHAYLLKISIAYNKKRISLLSLPINCISVRSTPEILSIRVIGLCNFTAKSLFYIFPFSAAPPAVFLSKHL